jgi:hypothetical protein
MSAGNGFNAEYAENAQRIQGLNFKMLLFPLRASATSALKSLSVLR